MNDFNFAEIAPHLGGKRESFEELCCQLARRSVPESSKFIGLHGDGGDGGVECYADSPDDKRTGWQAKYVFDMHRLLTQASASLKAALAIHSSLTCWVLCFPFDLTGPTGRKGQSGTQKFDSWKKKEERVAQKAGRCLTIEAWPMSKLLGELLKIDDNGGIRAFFFDSTVLTHAWFQQHLASAVKAAGPRYNRELSVETNLWKWCSALGRTGDWSASFEELLRASLRELDDLRTTVARRQDTALDSAWPETLRTDGEACVAHVETMIAACSQLLTENSRSKTTLEHAKQLQVALARCFGELSELAANLKQDLEAKHGEGKTDSVRYRQFMAEYQASFPMASLDSVRELKKALDGLATWLKSPAGWAAFEPTLLLVGIWGSGKTHGICDAAVRRLQEGHLSILAFGHAFGGEPDPWTRLREELALPPNLTRDGLLDALNCAAEASGNVMIVWLDAINETKPRRYWRDHLSAFADAVTRRPFLRLCVSCRTSYAEYCVPNLAEWYCAEHQGFLGNEREAAKTFFEHFNLDPPVNPILPPEFANPLYLKLVLETLKAKGLRSLPPGWVGLATAIRAFLEQKNREFAVEYEISPGAQVVLRGLQAIARKIATQGETALSLSAADQALRHAVAIPPTVSPVDWLVRENLLIEDVPKLSDTLEPEGTVRPAFERLGDFLVAQELLSGLTPGDLRTACQAGGRLAPYLGSPESVANNEGLVSALSILVPEQLGKGAELADLFDDGPTRSAIVIAAVRSYSWRDPSSFSSASQLILRQAFGIRGVGFQAMDAALTISCHSSTIDAFWIHALFCRQLMAHRDVFWCEYLHESYEASGPVKRLIDAAVELPHHQVEPDIAERWATILLWFAAAADRRVKDNASRGAIALLCTHPGLVPNIVARMLRVDDDAVRERTLLAAYGACILTKDHSALRSSCDVIAEALAKNPEKFHNALLRDHTRCFAELAQMLDIDGSAEQVLALLGNLKSSWPLDLPSEEQIKIWDGLPKLAYSCLHDDFFVYSLNCLDEWGETIPKTDMGKWILRRIVEDFGYAGSGCEGYDGHMLNLYGGGRSKPAWAERIGKKYQWIAMYHLAARLSDHAVRKPERRFSRQLLRAPLILLEERQLDPTLQGKIAEGKRGESTWWIPATANLAASTKLTDAAWVNKRDDIPSLVDLLAPAQNGGKEWLLLNGHPSWDTRLDDPANSKPYRYMWIQVRGYLLDAKDCEKGFASIAGRNLFGRWMPEGATWLYGFAGEYPWGPAFTTEPESYHGRGGSSSDLPCDFIPIYNEIAAEWEYDSSLPRRLYIHVPARALFQPGDLWWNGKDGFLNGVRETVFRAPDVTEAGPSALIANRDDLLQRLDKIKKRLIWTLLGEKQIIRVGHDEPSPSCTFSQIARLRPDGSLRCSDLAFFDDRCAAVGPASEKLSSADQTLLRKTAAGAARIKPRQMAPPIGQNLAAKVSKNGARSRKGKGSKQRKAKKQQR